jgi:hypothetical protein
VIKRFLGSMLSGKLKNLPKIRKYTLALGHLSIKEFG